MKKSKLLKWRWPLILATPFVACSVFMLILISHYGVNTPFWDQWEMVPIFQKIDEGELPLADFWDQHNEHRILFPNIVLTISAYLTGWNVKAEMLISLGLSLITSLMLYLFVISKIRQRALALITATLTALWFYSPVQYENWAWGWQVEWFMCIAAITTSIFLLDKYCLEKNRISRKKAKLLFAGALAGAIVSTYSLGSGMLVWPIGIAIILLYGYRTNLKALITWSVSFLLAAGTYYLNYHPPKESPSNTIFLEQPMNYVRYIFNYYGRPISDQSSATTILGIVLLLISIPLIYLAWVKRDQISKFVPWLSLIALSLASGFVTGISRLGFGLDQSLSGRYTAFSLLFIIGLIGLIFSLLDTIKLKKSTIIFTVLMAAAINGPLLFASYTNGRAGFRKIAAERHAIVACTKSPSPTKACLLTTYPSEKIVKPRLEFIKSKNWAGY